MTDSESASDDRLIVNKAAFSCVVFGRPAPQGSKRHLGGHRMVEVSEHLPAWREAVKTAAREALTEPWMPLDGPLRLSLSFTLRKPASAPKRRQTWPDRTPDLSKLIRGVEDALVDAGVVYDDARFVLLQAVKVFPGEGPCALPSPGCVISIWRVSGADQ